MPWGLKRLHQTRQLVVTDVGRTLELQSPAAPSKPRRTAFDSSTNFCVYGYVVMPEHAHLLVSEPERGSLARAMQSLKQGVARRLALRAADSFWQARNLGRSLGSARDFGSGLGRPLNASSSWRSFVTFTVIRSSAGWSRVPRIGLGAVFVTI